MAAVSTANNNNSAIPVEDSLLYEFDESNLFEPNASSGFDRYEGGGKIAAGITARARWKGGTEISGVIGQRWRSLDDDTFEVASNLAGKTSDIVAGISADFGNPLRIETRARFGANGPQDGFALNRVDARLTSNWNRLRGSLRYYRIDDGVTFSGDPDEGVDIRGELRLTDNYSLVYARVRDIAGTPVALTDTLTGQPIFDPMTGLQVINAQGRDLLHRIGVAYEDDCSRFEVAFERSEALDRSIGPTDSLKFRFSLKTLGDFGSRDVD